MTRNESIEFLQQRHGISHVLAYKIFTEQDSNNLEEYAKHFLQNKKPLPFVKWVGGKRQLLKQFMEMGLYPPQDFDTEKNTYFEPFVGGGAFFFNLLPHHAILTDMNEELVVTYNVVKNNPKVLISKLKEHKKKDNKEYFLNIRSQKTARLSDVSRAARFIYLNKTAFSGMYRVNKSGGFNVPYGKYINPNIVDENNILKVSQALKHASIKHADYKEVLSHAKKGDFVYFDPPYFPVSRTASFTAYTKDAFLEQEQIELRHTFVELDARGCYVMLSNSDTPFIREIYEKCCDSINIHTVFAGRAINSDATKRGKISEVVITNY